MTPKYDPSGLDTLTDQVAGDLLREHAVAAEVALGLRPYDLTGTDADDARLAVAIQVNFQVKHDAEARLLKSYTRGERSYDYSAEAQAGIDPLAKRMADAIIARQTAPDSGGDYAIVKAL